MVSAECIRLRHARPNDAADVVELVCGSFPRSFVRCLALACSGARDHLAAELSLPEELVDGVRIVGTCRGAVAGYAEMKNAERTLFLNYIAISRKHRSRGLGRRLLAAAIRDARGKGSRDVALDVLEGNSLARAWYGRLGFVETTRTLWVAWRTNQVGGATGKVLGFGTAQASHEAFGFSEITVMTAAGPRHIGRLGKSLFRVADRRGLDRELLATLHRLDPGRKVLELRDGGGSSRSAMPGARVVAVTLRLVAPLDPVLERL